MTTSSEIYEIKREQDLREIVNDLDAQKSRLYDIADDAKQAGRGEDQDECYAMIDKIQDAMDAVSKAALKIEKKFEEAANKALYKRMSFNN